MGLFDGTPRPLVGHVLRLAGMAPVAAIGDVMLVIE